MTSPEGKTFFEEKIKPKLVLAGSVVMTAIGFLTKKIALIGLGLAGVWYANSKMKPQPQKV